MDLQLTGKSAIVTGGASGIGEAIVRSLLSEGVEVCVVGRSAARAVEVMKSFKAIGPKVIFAEAELSQNDDCKRAVKTALAEFGKIDILVNNAGKNDGIALSGSPEAFMNSIMQNLFHYFAMAHYALDSLKQTQGVIINVGSKVAVTGQGGTSGYAASKGACQALTREWAVDLLPYGIRVNEVVPAESLTPLYELWLNSFPDPKAEAEKITSRIPLGKRFTTTKELADMVVFLASPLSGHTTGQHIYVDGGYTHLDRRI